MNVPSPDGLAFATFAPNGSSLSQRQTVAGVWFANEPRGVEMIGVEVVERRTARRHRRVGRGGTA